MPEVFLARLAASVMSLLSVRVRTTREETSGTQDTRWIQKLETYERQFIAYGSKRRNLRKPKYTLTSLDMLHVDPNNVPYCRNTVAPRYFELIYFERLPYLEGLFSD